MSEILRIFAKSISTAHEGRRPRADEMPGNNKQQSHKRCARHGHRAENMKKIIAILTLAAAFCCGAWAQTPEVSFNKIPQATFPCQLSSKTDTLPPLVFNTARDLSIYCSGKAQDLIKKSQGFFVAGVTANVLGGVLFSYGANGGSEGEYVLGAIIMIGGAVFDIISVADLLGHWKWDYRRKQVDLYPTPAGVNVTF